MTPSRTRGRGRNLTLHHARARGGRPGAALAKPWQPVFLEKLAELGGVSYAAAATGVSRQVVYQARKDDRAFTET